MQDADPVDADAALHAGGAAGFVVGDELARGDLIGIEAPVGGMADHGRGADPRVRPVRAPDRARGETTRQTQRTGEMNQSYAQQGVASHLFLPAG